MPNYYCRIEGTTKQTDTQVTYFEGGHVHMSNRDAALGKAKERVWRAPSAGAQGTAAGYAPRAHTYLVAYDDPGSYIGCLGVCGAHNFADSRRKSLYGQIMLYNLQAPATEDFIPFVLDANTVTEKELSTVTNANSPWKIDRTYSPLYRWASDENRVAVCNALLSWIDGKKVILQLNTEGEVFERQAREILVLFYSLIPRAHRWRVGFTTYCPHENDFVLLRDSVQIYVLDTKSDLPSNIKEDKSYDIIIREEAKGKVTVLAELVVCHNKMMQKYTDVDQEAKQQFVNFIWGFVSPKKSIVDLLFAAIDNRNVKEELRKSRDKLLEYVEIHMGYLGLGEANYTKIKSLASVKF